jgi:hypothetical protein
MVKQMIKARAPLPQWFVDEPAIDPIEQTYLSSFVELQTCRGIGMELGPIPWRDTVEYADRLGLTGEIHRTFVAVIRQLDNVYLTHLREKNAEERAEREADAAADQAETPARAGD